MMTMWDYKNVEDLIKNALHEARERLTVRPGDLAYQDEHMLTIQSDVSNEQWGIMSLVTRTKDPERLRIAREIILALINADDEQLSLHRVFFGGEA